MFKPEATSLPVYFKEKSAFKNAPVIDGKIDPKYQSKIKDFLIERDHDLEEYSPKALTEEQQAKITEISNFLTGKASTSFKPTNEAKPTSDDFNFEENFSEKTSKQTGGTEEEDDFFSEL